MLVYRTFYFVFKTMSCFLDTIGSDLIAPGALGVFYVGLIAFLVFQTMKGFHYPIRRLLLTTWKVTEELIVLVYLSLCFMRKAMEGFFLWKTKRRSSGAKLTMGVAYIYLFLGFVIFTMNRFVTQQSITS